MDDSWRKRRRLAILCMQAHSVVKKSILLQAQSLHIFSKYRSQITALLSFRNAPNYKADRNIMKWRCGFICALLIVKSNLNYLKSRTVSPGAIQVAANTTERLTDLIRHVTSNSLRSDGPSHVVTKRISLLHISARSTKQSLLAGRPGFASRQEQSWDFFSPPPRPDRLWDSPIPLSNGYWRLFPRE
jgi:hypothetical protein